MTALYIILIIVLIAIYVIGGIICGKICAEIVRDKNENMSEIMWFWAGFFFNIIAIFATFAVKNRKQ